MEAAKFSFQSLQMSSFGCHGIHIVRKRLHVSQLLKLALTLRQNTMDNDTTAKPATNAAYKVAWW